jgi:hypothetical protein
MSARRPSLPLLALLGLGLAAGAAASWAAFAPLPGGSHDEIFEIPQGTWARRMAGNQVEILPSRVFLTLGLKDVLVLKNRDAVPQIFGPVLMMPGQTFRLPFEQAASYTFACTAHASGQMTVIVDPPITGPWTRLSWRVRSFARAARL